MWNFLCVVSGSIFLWHEGCHANWWCWRGGPQEALVSVHTPQLQGSLESGTNAPHPSVFLCRSWTHHIHLVKCEATLQHSPFPRVLWGRWGQTRGFLRVRIYINISVLSSVFNVQIPVPDLIFKHLLLVAPCFHLFH